VIDQSRRRVLNGEQVPTAEKIYSIFEPHTDLIKRGKVQTPIEFGHKVFLAESARGLITQYEVLDGNPVDEQHVVPSLKYHKQAFGHAPDLYGSDRGFFSEHNVASCKLDASRSCASHNAAAPKRPSEKPMRRVRSSRTASASERVSRGASRCCSAVAA
jgi:IS5 family transposase